MSSRGLLLVAALSFSLGAAADETSDELVRKYRETLRDASPGELYVIMGEELWRAPRGPRKVSLERCDFGLGPGALKGAYAQLPRYFADTEKVEDVESRLATCMASLQGYTGLLGYGKSRGAGDAAQRQAYERIYNAQAFTACSAMPRFGHNGVLTPEQIAHLVALLLDPASEVNR